MEMAGSFLHLHSPPFGLYFKGSQSVLRYHHARKACVSFAAQALQ